MATSQALLQPSLPVAPLIFSMHAVVASIKSQADMMDAFMLKDLGLEWFMC